MKPKYKDTFTDDVLISSLIVLGVIVFSLLYFSTTPTFTDIPTPYKPTKSPDPLIPTLYNSISQLQNSSSLLETLISELDDPLFTRSLTTCDDLLKHAVTNLNESVNLLTKGPGDDDLEFTDSLRMWIGFAILDQESCLHYMEKELGSQILGEQVGLRLDKFKQCINNNVAILEKISPLFKKYRVRVCLYDYYICATI